MKKTRLTWSDYLMELLIVIIGISIAFWLNNVAIESQNKKESTAYLTAIKNDLKTDKARLSANIKKNNFKSEKLSVCLEMIQKKAPIDSLLVNILEIGNYDFFDPDNFTLTSLLQSGDLKLIDSEQVKRELLRLLKIYESIDNMQKNFLHALDDNYFPMLLTKVDMIEFKAVDPDFFYGVEIKNYCGFTLNETSQHIQNYLKAQSQVNKVIILIDTELKK
tara:strand:- start:8186 stop:8845 length:660 start_codon:yes stop_codon:yes gene_type:complete